MNVVNDSHAMIANIMQVLVMASILSWSVFFMLRRVAPTVIRNQQYRLAHVLSTRGWVKLGHWLEPVINTGGGCGSGCNTCGSCPSNPHSNPKSNQETNAKDIIQPVQWKNPAPSKSSGFHS